MISFLFLACVAYILYSYAGYPLILWLVNRIVPRSEYGRGYQPSVSLLIPAYNEEAVIKRKIENSLELDYPREKLQIIVAADGSDDRTAEIVKDFEPLGVILNFVPDRAGKMAAINRAVDGCTGEIIVFSDANNFYMPDTITELIQPFQDELVGSTTGAKHIIEEDRAISSSEGLYWKYESAIKEYETTLGSCVSSVGEILAVRKNLFKPAPPDTINDDQYIIFDILKRGYKNIYVPSALSLEYASPSAKDEVTRRRRISRGAFQFIFRPALVPYNRPLEAWKILSHKFSRYFMPFVMILTFILNIGLVVFPSDGWLGWPENWILLSAQISFYIVGLFGNKIKLPGKIGKLAYLPTFLINSNYALMAGFFAYFKRSDGHLWKRVSRTELPADWESGK